MPETVRYENVEDAIARVVMARPEKRNAQSRRMTYELDEAFMRAAHDDAIKVIVLSGDGPHFSSGHDLRDAENYEHDPLGVSSSRKGGTEGHMALEDEIYIGMCRRWREIPKPTIAQVHGKTIAGGLMLAWVCDLIVCTEEATFRDLTVDMGVNGVEWFAHPWELGHRKAKEMLFTGDEVDAHTALRLGMVNHVVPGTELEEFTLALARKIAAKPSFSLKLAKLAVNQAQDAQGFWTAMQAAFSLQHLGHAQWRETHR